jgi:jasmonate ZIM domain-containing protein
MITSSRIVSKAPYSPAKSSEGMDASPGMEVAAEGKAQ